MDASSVEAFTHVDKETNNRLFIEILLLVREI